MLDKAAALLQSMAYHHVFMDGNKRTALRAVTLFLDLNGYETLWDQPTQYNFILEVAQGSHDIPHIAAWLARHTREKHSST
jgi:death-on-curing protein